MNEQINRRVLLERSAGMALAAGAALAGPPAARAVDRPIPSDLPKPPTRRTFKLGLVTHDVAADWDLDTIIKRCREVGLAGVEFRSTHKHGVEPALTKAQRQEVRKKCADGGLEIWGLGSTCEFHSPDPAVLARNLEEARRFIDLAHDLGAKAVKVRPNDLPKEVPEEKTLEQIGRALRTCGEAGAQAGVQIACEVHGRGTCEPPRMRKIIDVASHPNVGVVWNSNQQDIKDGSVKAAFALLGRDIFHVHINELTSGYPWRELFTLPPPGVAAGQLVDMDVEDITS